MTVLFVVRHGQTDWNLERRWQGHADRPLNDAGRSQARALALSLVGREIEAVYSSDLARARETAEILAEQLGRPVSLDERLREVDVGEWSGLTTSEVAERFPEGLARRREGLTGWDQGESFEAMSERVTASLLAIGAAHPHAAVIVVTHGGPVRAASAAAVGGETHWASVGNCDFERIAVEQGRLRWLDSSRGGLHQQVQG